MIYTENPTMGKLQPVVEPFPMSFDFNDGPQGWTFWQSPINSDSIGYGSSDGGRLSVWSSGRWANACWRYTYPDGLYAVTGATITFSPIYAPGNCFMDIYIGFVDGRVIRGETKMYWPAALGSPLILTIGEYDNNRMIRYIEWHNQVWPMRDHVTADNCVLTGFKIVRA